MHRSGKLHSNADALSRITDSIENINSIFIIDTSKPDIEKWKKEQINDSELLEIFKDLQDKNSIFKDQFIIHDGLLLRNYQQHASNQRNELLSQIVVPKLLQQDVLEMCHNVPMSGHLGIKKTYSKIKERFWWKNMLNDIKQWIYSC